MLQVLTLVPKTRQKKKKWKQVVSSEWLLEERPIMKKHLEKKKSNFKKFHSDNENILPPIVSKITLLIKKRTKRSLSNTTLSRNKMV